MALTIEMTIGSKKHLVSGMFNFSDGVYLWSPINVQELTTVLKRAGYTIDVINSFRKWYPVIARIC